MRLGRFVLPIVALGLVAAACGGTDDLEADSTPTTRQRFPAAVVPTSAPEPTSPFGGEVVHRAPSTTRRASPSGAAPTTTAVTAAPRVAPASTPMPSGRTAVGGVAWQGVVVVAGGFDGTGNVSARVDSYDPATGQWKQAPRLPVAVHHVSLAVLGDDLWAIGGFGREGDQSLARAETYVFRPGGTVWEPGPRLSTARGAAAVATVDDTLVVIGGATTDGAALDTVETLARGAGSWSNGATLARKRAYASAIVSGGRVYVAGGRTGDAGSSLRSVESWKPGGGWRAEPALATPRSSAASAGSCVGGGENGAGDLASVECFAAGKWSARFTLHSARRGLGAGVVAGWLHFFGGASASSTASVVHDVFDVG